MPRLSYANVMSSVAVFVALGGTGYAATKIGSADVRNNSLTGADVRNRSLTGTDIRDRSIAARDLRAGTVPAASRWFLLNESGDIEEQSGGFTVVSKPNVNGQPPANPNVYVDAGSPLTGSGLFATTAIQNTVDRDANGMPDPSFKGDVAVGRCNTAAINCVPMGTNVDNVLVVRALADNATATSQTRRVYVQVTP